ncbi:alkaline phosphatase [Bacillus sp. FJAT-49736]|uniref:alkaline phosphatase n=1 Tax=Bacillus sp. FJAT-49736 TaxID=2833582 RepID=UPI001BCA418F|nr:alkaline phosphatase [Bacillus sp. FJAT-49736]MBS4175451.1 alkaline phosphatase [Bacillus sp. FJAT-49736]
MRYLVLFILFLTPFHSVHAAKPSKLQRNVIFMVMDGTNSDALTLTRWYKGTELALDRILVGGVKTYSLQSGITDSAAAGTAMATGLKATANMIGFVPEVKDGKVYSARPAITILEAAKMHGLSTGIVSTSPVQHATPASFTAHTLNRDGYDDIAEQQVYQGMNVVLGGGKVSLIVNDKGQQKQGPTGVGSNMPTYRKDGENLLQNIKKSGYSFVETKSELKKVKHLQVWGSFADIDIAFEFDRMKLAPNQPSLAEMTKKAIHLLSKNEKGFFLFVEGSKIDWAAHKNDPVGMISEILSFDAAVQEAVQFAESNSNTLLIAVTDHGNSGLTMGNHNTNKSYSTTPVHDFIDPLKKAKLTAAGAVSLLKKDRSNLKEIAKYYGLEPLKESELIRLKTADNVELELAKQMANRANLGFTTQGHSGEDVFLYAYGPGKPSGLINNTDFPTYISKFLRIPSLKDINQSYFIKAKDYYAKKGYKVKIDFRNSYNPLFIAEKKGTKIIYPVNKNYRIENGKKVVLKGVNIFANREFWISSDK